MSGVFLFGLPSPALVSKAMESFSTALLSLPVGRVSLHQLASQWDASVRSQIEAMVAADGGGSLAHRLGGWEVAGEIK